MSLGVPFRYWYQKPSYYTTLTTRNNKQHQNKPSTPEFNISINFTRRQRNRRSHNIHLSALHSPSILRHIPQSAALLSNEGGQRFRLRKRQRSDSSSHSSAQYIVQGGIVVVHRGTFQAYSHSDLDGERGCLCFGVFAEGFWFNVHYCWCQCFEYAKD